MKETEVSYFANTNCFYKFKADLQKRGVTDEALGAELLELPSEGSLLKVPSPTAVFTLSLCLWEAGDNFKQSTVL